MSFDLWDVCGWIIVRDTPVESHDATTMWHIWWGTVPSVSVHPSCHTETHGGTHLSWPKKITAFTVMQKYTDLGAPYASVVTTNSQRHVCLSSRLDEAKVVCHTLPEITACTWKWMLGKLYTSSFWEGRFLGAMLVKGSNPPTPRRCEGERA